MGSENRYDRTTKYKINLINMNFLVENTKFDDKCRNSSIKALDFTHKMSQCMERLQNNAR